MVERAIHAVLESQPPPGSAPIATGTPGMRELVDQHLQQVMSETPSNSLGSITSEQDSDLRECNAKYKKARDAYTYAEFSGNYSDTQLSALKAYTIAALEEVKRVRSMVNKERVGHDDLKAELLEVRRELAELNNRFTACVIETNRATGNNTRTTRSIIRRELINQSRRKFYNGMILFLEGSFIFTLKNAPENIRTYDPRTRPRSDLILPVEEERLDSVISDGENFRPGGFASKGSEHSTAISNPLGSGSDVTTLTITASRNNPAICDVAAPVDQRIPHPALSKRNYFRSSTTYGKLDWNKFWDKLLLPDAVSRTLDYKHPVSGERRSRDYYWPSPDLFAYLKEQMGRYYESFQERIRALETAGSALPHKMDKMKRQLACILFAETALQKEHILRDCIVAPFPIMDEGNALAQQFDPDSSFSRDLYDALEEDDDNDDIPALVECVGYLRGHLSDDFSTLVKLPRGSSDRFSNKPEGGYEEDKGRGNRKRKGKTKEE